MPRLGTAKHAESIAKQLDDPNESLRRPKITYEDKFGEWEHAARPGTVFDEEEDT